MFGFIKGRGVVFLLVLQIWNTRADYDCLCAYAVETQVLDSPTANGNVLGYMYEFDCKAVYKGMNTPGMQAVQYEHKVGYVALGDTQQVQLCQGSISDVDKVYTTTTVAATTATTPAMSSSSVLSTTLQTTKAPTRNATTVTTSSANTSTHSDTSTTKTTATMPLTVTASQTSTAMNKTVFSTMSSPTSIVTNVASSNQPLTSSHKTSTTVVTTTTNPPPSTTTSKPSPIVNTSSTGTVKMSATSTATTSATTKPPPSTTTTTMTTSTRSTTTSTTTPTTPTTTPTTTTVTTSTRPTTTSTTPPTTTTTHRPLTCKSGWTQYKGSCYLFHLNNRNKWQQASDICVSSHAHLVFIESHDEDNFLMTHLKPFIHGDDEDSGIWIGGTDHDKEGTWVWHDPVTGSNTHIGSYTNWYPNEPDSGDNHHDEDCMCLIGGKGFSWQDYSCNKHMYFVCEMSLAANTHPTTAAPVKTPNPSTLNACSSGWLQSHGSCYYFGTSHRVVWDDAASACKKKQAHLAIIESQLEDEFLGTELDKRIDTDGSLKQTKGGDDSSDTGIWVGGSDRGTEGKWLWHDTYTGADKPFGSYSNWRSGEPDAGDHEHEEDCMCLIGRRGFQWQDYKCSEHMYYVCEKSPSQTVTQSPVTTSGLSCSNGWVLFQDNCYLFALNKGDKEWDEAATHCHHDHAFLVIIDSLLEQKFIESHISSHMGTDSHDGVWMGGTDSHHEGRWEWENTLTDQITPMSSYSNWQPGQPHKSDDDCLAMFKKDNFKWTDFRCKNNIKYVCEKPATRRFPSLIG